MSNKDKRIVEMAFENSQFESGIKTSMASLDKFKKALDFSDTKDNAKEAKESISGLNQINLSNIAAGVEALQKRFSTFGIVGMEVVKRITNSVIDLGMSIVNFAKDKVINGGISRAMNIENARFMLQGLLSDTAQVEAIMDDASKSVDGTAYSYDSAAKAAAQFAATGMRSGEQLQGALKAIAGTAAMTNSEYEDISRIFTTVAGNNRLMGDQLIQLSSRGLNAAATLKEFFNGVNDGSIKTVDSVKEAIQNLSTSADISEQQLRDWVSQGEISFEMFAAAMDNAFGEHAKKANDTFTGAMANIGAAFARIGADFVSPIVEQKSAVVDLFNSIRLKVNELRKALHPLSSAFGPVVLEAAYRVKQFIDSLNFHVMNEEVEKAVKGAKTLGELIGVIPEDVSKAQWEMTKYAQAFRHFVDGIFAIIDALTAVIKPIGKAFKSIFPKSLGDNLWDLAKKFENFFKSLKINDDVSQKLESTFKGLFAIVDLLGQAFKAWWEATEPIRSALGDIAYKVLTFTANLGEYLAGVDKSVKSSGKFTEMLKELQSIFSKIQDKIAPIIEKIAAAFDKMTTSVKEWFKEKVNVEDFFNTIRESVNKTGEKLNAFDAIWGTFKTVIGGIWEVFKTMLPGLAKVGSAVGDVVAQVFNSIIKIFKGEGFDDFLALLNGGILATLGIELSKFVGTVGNLDIVGTFRQIANATGIPQALRSVKTALTEYQKELKTQELRNIAESIAILAAALFVLSTIDTAKMYAAVGAMGALMAELLVMVDIMSMGGGEGKTRPFKSMIDDLEMITKGHVMKQIAEAVIILSGAVAIIGHMDAKQVGVALLGITVLIGEMIAAVNLMPSDTKIAVKATQMIGLATAVLIMSSAFEKIGAMDMKSIGKALAGITGILIDLVVAMSFFALDNSTKGAAAMLIAATALTVLGGAMHILGALHTNEIIKALVAIAGALTIFGVATVAISEWNAESTLMKMGGALAIFSVGLIAMAAAFKIFGTMDFEEICLALVAIGGAVLIFAGGMKFMGAQSANVLKAAAAFGVVAVALIPFAAAMKILATLNIEQVCIGLAAIAGVLLVFGGMATLLGPLVPVILQLSGAIALLGLSVAAIGAGMALFATGLATLAVSGVAGAMALASIVTIVAGSIPAVVRVVAEGLLEIIALIPKFLAKLAEAFAEGVVGITGSLLVIIGSICKLIIEAAPQIADAVVTLGGEIFRAATALLPKVAKFAWELLKTLLNGIDEHIEEVTNKAVDIVIKFVDTLGSRMGDIAECAADLIINFIYGLADAVQTKNPELMDAVDDLMMALIEAILMWIEHLWDVGKDIVMGIAEGIWQAIKDVAAAIVDVGKAILDAIKDFFGIHSPSTVMFDIGTNIIQGLINGLGSLLYAVGDIAVQIARKFMGPIVEASEVVGESIWDATHEAITGAYTGLEAMEDGMDQVAAHMALLTGHTADEMYEASGGKGKGAYYMRMFTDPDNDPNQKAKPAKIESYTTASDAVINGKDIQRAREAGLLTGSALHDGYKDGVSGVPQTASDAVEAGKKAAEAKKNELNKTGKDVGSELNNGFKTGAAPLPVSASDAVEAGKKAAEDKKKEYNKTGDELGKELNSGLKSGASTVPQTASDAVEQGKKAAEAKKNAYNTTGSTLGSNLNSGLKSGASTVPQTASDAVEAGKRAAENKRSSYSAAGSTLGTAIGAGISGSTGTVNKSASDLVEEAKNKARQKRPEFNSTGTFFAEGLAAGLKGNNTIWNAGTEVGGSLLRALKNKLGIASPSKEAIVIGRFVIEGLVNGIQNNTSDVAAIASDVGGQLISSLESSVDDLDISGLDKMSKAISKAAEIQNVDMDLSPVITPVLDMSQMQPGLDTIDSIFSSNRSFALSGEISRSPKWDDGGQYERLSNAITQSNMSANAQVVNAITEIRKDISDLSIAMSQMQMVMDSGVLVGEIADKMDMKLGVLAVQRGRGM